MFRLGLIELFIVMLIVAVLLALLALVVFLIVRLSRSGSAATPRETLLDTLRRRLAAGEITPEQYDELRRKLDA